MPVVISGSVGDTQDSLWSLHSVLCARMKSAATQSLRFPCNPRIQFSSLGQGRIQDFGKGGGGPGNC